MTEMMREKNLDWPGGGARWKMENFELVNTSYHVGWCICEWELSVNLGALSSC